jgi:hypothetical protein
LKWFTRSRILSTTDIRPGQLAWFRHALCALRINYAVAWWPKRPWRGFLWLLHVKGVNVGHVWVYRLPACTTAGRGRRTGARPQPRRASLDSHSPGRTGA